MNGWGLFLGSLNSPAVPCGHRGLQWSEEACRQRDADVGSWKSGLGVLKSKGEGIWDGVLTGLANLQTRLQFHLHYFPPPRQAWSTYSFFRVWSLQGGILVEGRGKGWASLYITVPISDIPFVGWWWFLGQHWLVADALCGRSSKARPPSSVRV